MLNLGQPRRLESIPSIWKTPYETFEKSKNNNSSSSSSSKLQQEENDRSSISPADLVNIRGIKIAGWTIETQRGSIADSKTIDELSDSWGIPLPEMPFDKNKILIRYEGKDSNEQSSSSYKWQYCFEGLSALKSVEGVRTNVALKGLKLNESKTKSNKIGGEEAPKQKRVQVSYANEWGKKREQQNNQAKLIDSTNDLDPNPNRSNFGPEVAMAAATNSIATARDYDWTYSSTWPGDMGGGEGSSNSFQPGKDPHRDRIPIERLGPPPTPGAKAEPILFFDDLILFEDELGDNGTSLLNVKVRVMPTGILVLQRFFLRVDHVVFRIFDTRMYVSFYDDETISAHQISSSPTAEFSKLSLNQAKSTQPAFASPFRVIRECSGYQERYADVRSRLPPYMPNDLSPLTDVGWVAQQLTKMDESRQRALLKTNPGRFGLHPGTTVPQDQYDPTQPAVLPNMNAHGQESNRILGEVVDEKDSADDVWEGQGHCVDIILLD